ncbi:MAG: alanine--tRNA ligase [Lachnospiraceae bacterium]|nr:alanine--tRNA ligase [Lachnospiraceae bacterium]
MRNITSKELRKEWIDFYVKRGHVDVGAVSLVSDGSTGAMFNVAGMQPIMPYLLGKKHPLGTRLCNVQGCVRTNDIDGVGDKSHLTFFEMMGSWSLGDYFKKERCQWSYELLTEVFKFDRDHLAATVFEGDENAPRDEEGAKYRIESGFKPENVFFLPKEDNWWGLEYGPCGPDSEMFYVSDQEPCGPDCRPGCHCGKYTEIGNDVFMQYDKQKDGSLLPLAKKNVDTGWGLERNLMFLNGIDDVYKTDLFAGVIASLEKASGKKYDEDEKFTRSMRIVADHLRTSVMLIGDEAKLLPANGGPGYVLRRLIRRAIRHARVLGLGVDEILSAAAIYIDDVFAESHPLLKQNREFILSELKKETERFNSTLENGMKEFKKILSERKASGVIDGKSAFYLYDTFGFPYELTLEMAQEEGISVDEEGFKESMEAQKKLARENANFSQKGAESSVFDSLGDEVVTTFTGYDTLSETGKVLALADGEKLVDMLATGAEGTIVTDRTSFYATMGGQKGDVGVILSGDGEFEVTDTVKLPKGRVGHIGKVIKGSVKTGESVKLEVCSKTRQATCMNHSATHLLQAALQEVLGKDVRQQGSYQDPDRTRFDFSYGQAVGQEELKKIETIVNEKIAEDLSVDTKVMSIEEAKATGAMALFGEKYGDSVRVVSMGDFSKELCGGTHVDRTGKIRSFKILSESGVAAGVRRIEAVTGSNVAAYYAKQEAELSEACALLKTSPDMLVERIRHLQEQLKSLSSENESLKSAAAKDALGDVMGQVKDVEGVKLLATAVAGVDMNGLRDLGDDLKGKIGEGVVVLASEKDGKVSLMVMATDGAQKMGAHAGNLIKAIAAKVGGGGGGRPNMAQAGGKNPAGIPDAIAEAEAVLRAQVTK